MNNIEGKDVLVVDDSPDLLEVIELTLAHKGANVHTATSGHEALRYFFSHWPDLVILDLMMPGMDGWEVCQRIRQVSEVPLIMLTALGKDTEIVQGLEYGADEYITKPVSMSVLLSRVQAVLRRAYLYESKQKPTIYGDGYLNIDLETGKVMIEGQSIKLSAIERRLLTYLYQHAGQVLTFEQILEHVWGKGYENNPEYVHVYISNLRKKIEPDPRRPIYFLTEHGLGYRFEKQLP
ncbi:MAG TPA: response regulator transcription factor [Anaerolineae bacterium]|nr:response regulator transcription factor [Anaerolineae bacterium]MCB0178822.1 response regulator transcription factor [Anaerolineae bacterium]MCB9107423.1 response regulator transcription factor [Anaerolineales bacterium]HRV93671.1 response regulator transcription factor [Anaerolineae bacterium]